VLEIDLGRGVEHRRCFGQETSDGQRGGPNCEQRDTQGGQVGGAGEQGRLGESAGAAQSDICYRNQKLPPPQERYIALKGKGTGFKKKVSLIVSSRGQKKEG